MDYSFIAEMRDGRVITLCEWDNLEFFESMMDQFEESDYIKRFIIGYNGLVINDKWLKPKSKQLVRRKENEIQSSKLNKSK